MKQSPSPIRPENLVKYIKHTDLFKAWGEADTQAIEAELEWIHLTKGGTLFEQGDAGNCLYVVISGQLGVVITQPDGTSRALDALKPGTTVGEMGLFTGQTPITAIHAIEELNLVKLSKAGFDRLAQKNSQLITQFSQIMLPRLRQVQLTSAFKKLFGKFSKLVLNHVEAELEWLHLYNGDVLVQQGDDDDALYIVISGRLRVAVKEQDNGEERIINEIGRGESIGELSSFTGERRSATVYAIRDTVVIKLTKASFDQMIEKYPQAMMEITRLIVQRLQQVQQNLGTGTTTKKKTATIAIIPIDQTARIAEFAHELVETLNSLGPTLHLNSTHFDDRLHKKGASQTPRDHPTSLALETWLNEQETIYKYVVYEADLAWTPWTRRCIRNADRVLIVGWADGDPKLGQLERRMNQMTVPASRELVLLHPPSTGRPKETHTWLIRRNVQSHHHVRLNHQEDLERLARRLTGNAIGLVLSGGAVRGFAHIGAIQAIREVNLPIDIIGGTSIGAIVAAVYALGWGYEEMIKAIKTFMSVGKIFDFTFPIVALAGGFKATKVLSTQFEGIQIEDLWLPYFCVSSNLTRAQQVIHQRGPLWKYLRSSSSLPAIFTPVVYEGDLLVDGAMINNLPIDVMHDFCQGGPLIAVDVSAETELNEDYQFETSLSGLQVLWSKLNPFIPEIKAPSIFNTLIRSIQIDDVQQRKANRALADLFINPPVDQFGSGDFDAYEAIIEAGYTATQEAIKSWLDEQIELEKQGGA